MNREKVEQEEEKKKAGAGVYLYSIPIIQFVSNWS